MKKCSKCGQVKSKTEFHKDKTHKDGLRSICKHCTHKVCADWRRNNHDKFIEYHVDRMKSGQRYVTEAKRPCAKCGENRQYLIQFHHIDHKTKEFTIGSSGVFKNKDKVKSEIEKCVCLCANCHAEYHWFYGKRPEKPVETLTEYLGRNPREI